jgi:hypothetical protein
VSANGLRILAFQPPTIQVLTNRCFERRFARRPNRVAGSPENRARQPTIWCEDERRSLLCDNLTGVSADEAQLASLTSNWTT